MVWRAPASPTAMARNGTFGGNGSSMTHEDKSHAPMRDNSHAPMRKTHRVMPRPLSNALPLSSKAAALSALIRQASIRLWRRPICIPTGWRAFRLAPSMRRWSPATRRTSASRGCGNSGRPSAPLRSVSPTSLQSRSRTSSPINGSMSYAQWAIYSGALRDFLNRGSRRPCRSYPGISIHLAIMTLPL
jgi:hypothetical protein